MLAGIMPLARRLGFAAEEKPASPPPGPDARAAAVAELVALRRKGHEEGTAAAAKVAGLLRRATEARAVADGLDGEAWEIGSAARESDLARIREEAPLREVLRATAPPEVGEALEALARSVTTSVHRVRSATIRNGRGELLTFTNHDAVDEWCRAITKARGEILTLHEAPLSEAEVRERVARVMSDVESSAPDGSIPCPPWAKNAVAEALAAE